MVAFPGSDSFDFTDFTLTSVDRGSQHFGDGGILDTHAQRNTVPNYMNLGLGMDLMGYENMTLRFVWG